MRRLLVVVLRARDPERVAEALRAAVGLGLRGDRVQVLAAAAGPWPARAERAAATLIALGHGVALGAGEAEIAAAVRQADAVEVWT